MPTFNPSHMVGKKFGSLTVSNYTGTSNKFYERLYECVCDCGEHVVRTKTSLTKGSKIKVCPKCRNKFISHFNWKGHGEISGDIWGTIQKIAHIREIEFALTIEEAWNLFLKQEQKCALTNVNINFARNKRQKEVTASLDRIDSCKGYCIENVQWVHKSINKMKMDLDQQEFIRWCKLVTSYSKE